MRLTGENLQSERNLKWFFYFFSRRHGSDFFNFWGYCETIVKLYNQEKLIFGEECDDTKLTYVRYVTTNNNYEQISCSGVSLSSGQIVLDKLQKNECSMQFSDSSRIVMIFINKVFSKYGPLFTTSFLAAQILSIKLYKLLMTHESWVLNSVEVFLNWLWL